MAQKLSSTVNDLIIRTKYAKLLNDRILTTKSIAERRRERDEAEKKRLEEAQRKIDLRNEFFNIDDGKLDKADLIEMGATSATFNLTEGDATSIPEDKHVTSQRFNDSASIIDTAGMTDQTVTQGGGIPANLESGPLASFVVENTVDEEEEPSTHTNEQSTRTNDKQETYSYDSDSYTRTKNSDSG